MGKYCAPVWNRYVLRRSNHFPGGILLRTSLILKTKVFPIFLTTYKIRQFLKMQCSIALQDKKYATPASINGVNLYTYVYIVA